MSDLRYSATLDTSQAERNLDRFQKAVVNVNDTFIRFRNTIATISLGTFLQQTINSAARLDALSKSTGIAADTLKGFSDAVRAGGGNADQAADAISDLVKNIGEAANGGGELVKAFAKVGVSQEELRTASEEDILRKTIDGLAKMGDSASRSANQAKLLGEALKTVDLKTVNGGLSEFINNARGYSSEAKAAADAQRQFATAVDKLQTVVLKVSKPLLDLVNAIDLTSSAVSKFFAVLGEALKFAAYAAGILLIGKAILFIGSAGLIAIAGIRTLGSGIAGLFKVLTTPLLRADLFKNLAMLSPAMATRIKAVTEAIGVPIAWLANHWGKLTIAVTAGIGALKKYFDLGKEPEVPTAPAAPETAPPTADRGQEARLASMAKIREAFEKNTLAAKQELKVIGEAISNQGFRLGLETSLIGKTEDQIELGRAMADLTEQMYNKQDDIRRQVEKLTLERGLLKKEQTEESKILSDQIGILQNQSKEVEELYGRHKEGIREQIVLLQSARKAEENRLFVREQIVKSLQAEAAQQQNLNNTMRSINQKMSDIKFGVSLTGLSPLKKQIAEINQEAKKMATEAGNAFAATFEDKGFLTPEEAQELADGLAQIANGYKGIADEQIKGLKVSAEYLQGFPEITDEALKSFASWREEFSLGAKDAFTKFKEDSMDAGKQAADSFQNFTQGMEDAFVKFAQTGKLSFKDLANSIIADLVRIAVKKAIVGVIGGPIGALFGMAANGGPISGPTIVGERGPELFVPASAGKIISNSTLKNAGNGSSSMPQQTVVNYNIQAVDASSFRSLVAKDPSFIFAVTEQGRRSQPTRSR